MFIGLIISYNEEKYELFNILEVLSMRELFKKERFWLSAERNLECSSLGSVITFLFLSKLIEIF